MHLLMGSVSTLDKKYSRMFVIIFCVFLYFLNLMHLLMEGVSIPEKTQAEYGNVAKFKFTESIMVAFLRAKI